MHRHRTMTRRSFLGQTAMGAAVAPLILRSVSLLGQEKPAPSERITLGVIGTDNQGFNDMRGFLGDPRVQIVAVCDVNKESPGYWNGKVAGREPGRKLVEDHYAEAKKSGTYKGCDAYEDFRDLLARKDIDAVLICTPDHWHAIPTIMAAKAGKDIYCQKPLSLTITEGRAMSDAVKKYNRVFQTGSHISARVEVPERAVAVQGARAGALLGRRNQRGGGGVGRAHAADADCAVLEACEADAAAVVQLEARASVQRRAERVGDTRAVGTVDEVSHD